MKITLGQPATFSLIGLKDNQEDRICPSPDKLTPDTRCFVLCDGMGGHEHGEVAATIVSQTLYLKLTTDTPDPDTMTTARFDNALVATYRQLDTMNVGQGRRPGTTMTCLYNAANGLLAAHIGDSRIYQVRPGQGIIFVTHDHSLLNQLVDSGQMTLQQAAADPRHNVITRAMQPGLEQPFRADLSLLTDVRAGDWLVMCSDGVLEQVSEQILTDILSAPGDAAAKAAAISQVCSRGTRDNHTAIVIPVLGAQQDAPVVVDLGEDTAHNTAPAPDATQMSHATTPEAPAPAATNAPRQYTAAQAPQPVAPAQSTAPAATSAAKANTAASRTNKRLKLIIWALCAVIAILVTVYFVFLRKPGPHETIPHKPSPDTTHVKQSPKPATHDSKGAKTIIKDITSANEKDTPAPQTQLTEDQEPDNRDTPGESTADNELDAGVLQSLGPLLKTSK